MPGYCTHLIVGTKVADSLSLPEALRGEFLFGCLAPDAHAARKSIDNKLVIAAIWDEADKWDRRWTNWRSNVEFEGKTFSQLNSSQRRKVIQFVRKRESLAPMMIRAADFLRHPFHTLAPFERMFLWGYIGHLATDEAWFGLVSAELKACFEHKVDIPKEDIHQAARRVAIALDVLFALSYKNDLNEWLRQIANCQRVDILTYVKPNILDRFRSDVVSFIRDGLEILQADATGASFAVQWARFQRHLVSQDIPPSAIEQEVLSIVTKFDHQYLLDTMVNNSATRIKQFIELEATRVTQTPESKDESYATQVAVALSKDASGESSMNAIHNLIQLVNTGKLARISLFYPNLGPQPSQQWVASCESSDSYEQTSGWPATDFPSACENLWQAAKSSENVLVRDLPSSDEIELDLVSAMPYLTYLTDFIDQQREFGDPSWLLGLEYGPGEDVNGEWSGTINGGEWTNMQLDYVGTSLKEVVTKLWEAVKEM